MVVPDDHEVTRLLAELAGGVPDAAERLAPIVYDELHRRASMAMQRESTGHTLQATELVHEAFLKLVGQRNATWQNRSQFYAVASQAIRRLLIDHARKRRSAKRDHGIRVTLDDAVGATEASPLDLLALDEALRRLEAADPRQGRVVELRFFAGLSVEDTATVLGISPATVKRDWTFARAFLLHAMDGTTPDAT